MTYDLILEITNSFYDKVKVDIMIGYHFRFIEDFDEHIPRIAQFWHLQLNGEVIDRTQLPFNLLDVHKNMGIKRAEVGRWITLFTQNLDEFYAANKISEEHKMKWLEKVELFKTKIEAVI